MKIFLEDPTGSGFHAVIPQHLFLFRYVGKRSKKLTRGLVPFFSFGILRLEEFWDFYHRKLLIEMLSENIPLEI